MQLVLREIRVEHTLFALPFAYVGAIFAARGLPSFHAFVWITLAVLGARTAAMATNRYVHVRSALVTAKSTHAIREPRVARSRTGRSHRA